MVGFGARHVGGDIQAWNEFAVPKSHRAPKNSFSPSKANRQRFRLNGNSYDKYSSSAFPSGPCKVRGAAAPSTS